jgi:hypothetical protein
MYRHPIFSFYRDSQNRTTNDAKEIVIDWLLDKYIRLKAHVIYYWNRYEMSTD